MPSLSKIIQSFLLLFSVLLLVSSCKKEDKADKEKLYWSEDFQTGNFLINSLAIPIYTDISTLNHSADYVKKNELSDSAFHQFAIKLYFPIDADLYTIVPDSVSATLKINNVSMEISADLSGQSIQYIDENQFSVFEITGNDTAALGNKDSFQNITFAFYFHYVDQSNDVRATRQVKADIYKKE